MVRPLIQGILDDLASAKHTIAIGCREYDPPVDPRVVSALSKLQAACEKMLSLLEQIDWEDDRNALVWRHDTFLEGTSLDPGLRAKLGETK